MKTIEEQAFEFAQSEITRKGTLYEFNAEDIAKAYIKGAKSNLCETLAEYEFGKYPKLLRNIQMLSHTPISLAFWNEFIDNVNEALIEAGKETKAKEKTFLNNCAIAISRINNLNDLLTYLKIHGFKCDRRDENAKYLISFSNGSYVLSTHLPNDVKIVEYTAENSFRYYSSVKY